MEKLKIFIYLCERCTEEFYLNTEYIIRPYCPNCGRDDKVHFVMENVVGVEDGKLLKPI